MTTTVDVLSLRPADLAASLPLWEIGVATGDIGVAVIDGSAREWVAAADDDGVALGELLAAPVITLGVVRDAPPAELVERCDLVVGPGDAPQEIDLRVDELIELINRMGAPSLVAAQLLRAGDARIVTESFAYSMLMSGESFKHWRAGEATHRPNDQDAPRVHVQGTDAAWIVTLSRPARHNAFDARMREELCDALDAIASAPPLPIVILGAGPSFCSGGDLDEFGSAHDPVAAHLVRTGRSVARRLQRLRHRLVAGVHGHCIGAGVEFAAFAEVVVSATTATYALPEMSVGLNLGAGGTVSVSGRIGRHRTLELLMRPRAIDAATAYEWGLVDELIEPEALVERCIEAARGLT